MISCLECSKKSGKVLVCKTCKKVYCKDHVRSTCRFCGRREFLPLFIKKENICGTSVQWTNVKKKSMGLIDFDNFNTLLVDFCEKIDIPTNGWKVFVFPSKKSSMEFAKRVIREISPDEFEYFRSLKLKYEKSHYTILKNPYGKGMYFLFNLGAVTNLHMNFLVKFVPSLMTNMGKLPMDKSDEDLKKLIVDSLFKYYSRLGFPFVGSSEFMLKGIRGLVENIKFCYLDHISLRDTLDEKNVYQAAYFLSNRIDVILSGVEWQYVCNLMVVFELINKYIQASSVYLLTKKWKDLNLVVKKKIQKYENELNKKLSKNKDIIKIIGLVKKTFIQEDVYSSYKSFKENIKTLLDSLHITLRTDYFIPDDVLNLMIITEYFKENLRYGIEEKHEYLGTVDDCIKWLEKIFKRNDIPPELSITAGSCLLDLLRTKLIYKKDILAYKKAVILSQEFADAAEKKIPKFHKFIKAPSYQDVVLALWSISQFSQSLSDEENQKKLLKRSEEIIEKYDILYLKLIWMWKDFVSTQDFEFLKQIYKRLSGLKFKEDFRYLEPDIKMFYYLASAIFERENKKQNMDRAIDYALEQGVPDTSPLTFRTSRIKFKLMTIFSYIINANNETSEKKINTYIGAASSEASELQEELFYLDPFNIFLLKTQILDQLRKNNFLRLKKLVNSLEKFQGDSEYIKSFIETVRNWVSVKENKVSIYSFVTPQILKDSIDPWVNMLLKIIKKEFFYEIEKTILSFDSIVFVEGKYDLKIYPNFLSKICPKSKFYFMDTEGWSNVEYYTQARILNKIKGKVYVILDGDVAKIAKHKKIKKKLKALNAKVFTLKKKSIEDYLLVPGAIKRAFPMIGLSEKQISNFFDENKNKKDKKRVLDNFLKKNSIGKYSPEIAAKIVKKMDYEDIDDEIKNILNSIANKN